jgi:hypothetical protein
MQRVDFPNALYQWYVVASSTWRRPSMSHFRRQGVLVFSRLSTCTSGPPAKDRKVMTIDWYDVKIDVCAVVIHPKIVRK